MSFVIKSYDHDGYNKVESHEDFAEALVACVELSSAPIAHPKWGIKYSIFYDGKVLATFYREGMIYLDKDARYSHPGITQLAE